MACCQKSFADLHLDDLLVEVEAAVVGHLHEPFFLAGRALRGFLNVSNLIRHQHLMAAVLALEAGLPAHNCTSITQVSPSSPPFQTLSEAPEVCC